MARLRVGVIGLGRRWPRYRQALLALAGEARVVALCDASATAAREEAARLGCAATAGVMELLDRDDVDAVILTGGWYGLWPLTHAASKPVLCAGHLLREPDVEALGQSIGNAPVHMALWPTFELLTEAVAQRLGEMGAPRVAMAGRVMTEEGDPLESGATLALLLGISGVFEASPRRVTAVRAGNLISAVLEFDDGVGQLSLWAGPADVGRAWLDVDAEGGCVRAQAPRSLSWEDAEGRHSLELPGGLAEVWAVDRFVQAVRAGEPPACTFARARQAREWLVAMRRSLEEGKGVSPGA